MKVAIHHRKGSFSDYWIEYCDRNHIDYILVNCYSSDIVEELKGCKLLLWNWVHWHSSDILFAKQLINSLEQSGMFVYPSTRTNEYFDDKLGQKYLFESLNIPFVKSDVFYDKSKALEWIQKQKLPLVFKLRGGAGSVNVKLIKTKRQANRIIRKSFNKGFKYRDQGLSNLKDRIYKFKENKSLSSLTHVLKGVVRIFYADHHSKLMKAQKGYVYFQEFIPGNDFDIRVAVIGDKAVALKRMVRKNDFRASGSGHFILDPEEIGVEYIEMAFNLNKKLKMQSVAFDFIKDGSNIKVVEISYNFVHLTWPGYWNANCEFIKDDNFRVADFMIEDLIRAAKV